MKFDDILVRLVAVNPERFSLGLAYLEASLRARFDAQIRIEQSIFDLDGVRRHELDLAAVARVITVGQPVLIGLSWYCWNHRLIQDLARLCNQILPHCQIVVGGPETLTIEESELERFPVGTIFTFGEGEWSLCEIVGDLLQTGRVSELPAGSARCEESGIARMRRREAPEPTELIPSPVLAGTLRDAVSEWIPSFTTTRGCIYSCSFCAWHDGFREREFDLQRVLRELESLARRPYERIWFTDTIFGRNEPRSVMILERLQNWPHPTRFAFELHARFLSRRLARELAAVPLAWAAVGIQSLAPHVLRLTRRSPLTDQIFESVGQLYTALADPSKMHLDVIFGLPQQTVEDCFETVDILLEAFPGATLFAGMLQILAGTAFEALRRRPGWIVLPPEEDCEVVATPHMTADDMERVRDLMVGLDAFTIASGNLLGTSGTVTAPELEAIGRSLRSTAFAAHPVYGRRERFTAGYVAALVETAQAADA